MHVLIHSRLSLLFSSICKAICIQTSYSNLKIASSVPTSIYAFLILLYFKLTECDGGLLLLNTKACKCIPDHMINSMVVMVQELGNSSPGRSGEEHSSLTFADVLLYHYRKETEELLLLLSSWPFHKQIKIIGPHQQLHFTRSALAWL